MSDLARLLQQYGHGEQPNALAQDGVTYDTSNVLAGMPKKNALADALRIAMQSIPENKDLPAPAFPFDPRSLSMANMVRGGLDTAASWLDYQNKPQPSDYKPSDVMGPLGAGFMGSLFAPKNALGIFGGRIAANRLADAGVTGPRSALEMAERMHAQGASMPEIRSATNSFIERQAPEFGGVHLGRDGQWRFEIDDRGLAYNPSADWRPATEHFPHKVFELAYPEARSIDSMVATGNGIKFPAGYVEDLGTPHASMMVRTPEAQQARKIAAHEFQHVAQAAEGFDFGSSPAAVKGSPLYRQFVEDIKQSPTYRNASPEAQKAAEDELARRLYTYLAGEVEAENTANRLALSPEQRRAIPPSETAPVSERSQFLLRDLWPE